MVKMRIRDIRRPGSGQRSPHQDRDHAEPCRNNQVARIILEHDGPGRVNSGTRNDLLKGCGRRFRVIGRILDPENGVERIADTPGRGYILAMLARPVGIDRPISGQGKKGRCQIGGRGKMCQIDVMDLLQKRIGIDAIDLHQPGQRRSVIMPEIRPQFARRIGADPEFAHDELFHARLNLIEKTGLRGIKRVVEVEDPVFNMRKIHGAGL